MSRDEILNIGSYQSPITLIQGKIVREMVESIDGTVMRCVENIGVDVDKEELLKALRYDRDQYEKGYNDGVRTSTSKMTPMKPNKTSELMGDLSKYGIGYCPHCGTGVNDEMKYCSECGQALDWSDEDDL